MMNAMGRGILLILQLQGDAGTDELSDKYGKHRRIMHDLRAKALLMKNQRLLRRYGVPTGHITSLNT